MNAMDAEDDATVVGDGGGELRDVCCGIKTRIKPTLSIRLKRYFQVYRASSGPYQPCFLSVI